MSALDDLVLQYAAFYFERELLLLDALDGRTPAFDADLAKLVFGEGLAFQAQALATESGGQWRWAWGQTERYEPDVLRSSQRVRSRAVALELSPLLEAALPLDEVDTQALAIASLGLSGADAHIQLSAEGETTHWLIKDPTFPRPPLDADGVRAVFEHTLERRKLSSARVAFVAYLEQHRITHKELAGDVVGLTPDGQVLSARFDEEGGRVTLSVKESPPAGFPLDRLEWRNDAAEVILTLGSTDVAVLGRMLSSQGLEGKEFSLKGPRGRLLSASPAPRGTPLALDLGEKQLALRLSREAVEDALSVLRPGCGEYRAPGLPGLTLEVVASEVLDASGKVSRTIGWDPLPVPTWAIEPQTLAAARQRQTQGARRARRRIVLALLLAFMGFWPCLIALGSYRLRHVPYTIPEAYVAPPPGFAMALGAGLRLKYLGISGYEVTDGRTVILLDPVMTRPRLIDLVSGPLEVDESLHKPFRRADYIIVNHAHHDHALGVPELALRTHAIVVGSQSVINLALSRGVPPEKTLLAKPGERLRLGTFSVDVRETRHSAVLGMSNFMAGTIPADAGPLWFNGFTNDGTRFYRLEANGASLWFHPSSSYTPGEYDRPAGTLIMGVAGEGLTAAKARGILGEAAPQWVLPTHYDNFFQPRSLGLAALPTIDLDAVLETLSRAKPSATRCYLLDYDQVVELPGD